MFSRIDHKLGFRDEPFMKEALDSRAMSRGSSVVAGGREWTRCWISLARAVASGSQEPSGSPRVPTCTDLDASTSMGLWRFQHWQHAFIPSPAVKARQSGVRNSLLCHRLCALTRKLQAQRRHQGAPTGEFRGRNDPPSCTVFLTRVLDVQPVSVIIMMIY